jgi:hypothetical protein
MRVLPRLLLAGFVLLVLALAPHAEAQNTYSFSWWSETSGSVFGEPFNGTIGDRGTARITSTADLLIIDFDTALGTAHIEIARDTFGFAEGRVPFEMHPVMGGRQLVDSQYLASYEFFGLDATAPWTFMVRVSIPGSGPQPQQTFFGTGTLDPFTAWLASPAEGATVNGTVPVEMYGYGGMGAARTFRLYADDVLISTQTSADGSGVSFNWNTTTVANGTHQLRLDAQDEAGLVASDVRNVTVNNATAATVTFSLTNDQVIRNSVPVQITVNGLAAGNKRFFIMVDGVQVGFRITTSPTTWWWNTLNYANGTHTLRVRVVDVNGVEATGEVRVIISN